jgi:hypothetical protein
MGKYVQGSDSALIISYSSGIFLQGLRKITELSIRTAGLWTKIRSRLSKNKASVKQLATMFCGT